MNEHAVDFLVSCFKVKIAIESPTAHHTSLKSCCVVFSSSVTIQEVLGLV